MNRRPPWCWCALVFSYAALLTITFGSRAAGGTYPDEVGSPRGRDAHRTTFTQAMTKFDQAQQILDEQPDCARQLFRSAAQRFHSLVAAGVVSGRLEFNLANCYLQASDVGRAILHYRRAERLIPRDPMLADNLAVARSRCIITIRPTGRSMVLRNAFFWHYQTSVTARTKAVLLAYVCVWVLLIVRSFGLSVGPAFQSVFPRRAMAVGAILCALFTAASGVSIGISHWADRNAPEGVVTAMDVVVSKGPGTGYQRQFEQPLQPGVEFTLRDRTRSGWWKIELPDGKSGWIEAANAELIPIDSV